MNMLILLALTLSPAPPEEFAFTCSSGFHVLASKVVPVEGGYALEYFDGLGVFHETEPGEVCTWTVMEER